MHAPPPLKIDIAAPSGRHTKRIGRGNWALSPLDLAETGRAARRLPAREADNAAQPWARRITTITAATLLFLVVGTANAAADTLRIHPAGSDVVAITPRVADASVDHAKRRFPPAPHCVGRTRVELNAPDLPVAPGTGGRRYYGSARPQTCHMKVRPLTTLVEVCAITVHEMGHLAGLEHHPDPRNPMHATGIVDDGGCEALIARLARPTRVAPQQARRHVLRSLTKRRPGTRLHCQRPTRDRQAIAYVSRCTVSRPGFTEHRAVTRTENGRISVSW